MAEPSPVEVKNEEPIKVSVTDAAGHEAPAKPVVESVKTTSETTTTKGDPAAITSAPPPIVADDAIRSQIAWAVIGSDTLTCLAIVIFLFKYGNGLSKDIITIVATMAGSIIGYRARDTGTVINYLFGSSSGSTAKSALLEKK